MRFCTFALTGLVEEALGTNQKPFLGLVWFVGWLVGLSVGLSVFRQNPIGDGAGGEILHFCFHRIGRGSTRNQSEAFFWFFFNAGVTSWLAPAEPVVNQAPSIKLGTI